MTNVERPQSRRTAEILSQLRDTTKDVEHNLKISYAKSLWKNNFP